MKGILFLLGSSLFLNVFATPFYDGAEREEEVETNNDLEDDSDDGYRVFEYQVSDAEHEILKRQATDAFRQRALQLHNQYRAKHGSPPLALDGSLNNEAQNYANQEARSNVQKHSCGPCNIYGENLAYTAGTQPQPHDAAAAEWACKSWYDEVSLYNFANPNLSNSAKFGHFTALVWKGSQRMGIGVAYGSKVSAKGNKMNTVYVVARYQPAGNVMTANEMRKNVQAPAGK